MRMYLLVGLATLFLSSNVTAHEYETSGLTIHHPYAYEVKKGGTTSWAFMNITNDGEKHDHLLGASTPIADNVDLMDGNEKIDEVEIDEHHSVKFKSDGIHLALNGIKKPIGHGVFKPMTLHFEHAGDVKVKLLFSPVGEVSMCDDASHTKKVKPKE